MQRKVSGCTAGIGSFPNQAREDTTAGAHRIQISAHRQRLGGSSTPQASRPRRVECSFLLAFFPRTGDKYRQMMFSRGCAFSLAVVFAALLAGHAQVSPPLTPAKPDYSQEASVVEEMSTRIAFDNDGNLTREQSTRVRVQTD